jgi:squalene/oxidosqualene cyclase-like protein
MILIKVDLLSRPKHMKASFMIDDEEIKHVLMRGIRGGLNNLACRQGEDGGWVGPYGRPLFLIPIYVIAQVMGNRKISDRRAQGFLQTIFAGQNRDGSLGLFKGSKGCLFTSCIGYVTARLLGERPHAMRMVTLRSWIHHHGGPVAAAPWGKFTLALMNLYDYSGLPPTLPELWILPYALPFHPGRLWYQLRQSYLLISCLYGMRIQRPEDTLIRELRQELYADDYPSIQWSRFRYQTASCDLLVPMGKIGHLAYQALALFEKCRLRLLREYALQEIFKHIEYEERTSNFLLLSVLPASLAAILHCHDNSSPERLEKSFQALERYVWEQDNEVLIQGYNSTLLWDTAFAVRSMLASPFGSEYQHTLSLAGHLIRAHQLTAENPDAAAHFGSPATGGWPFSSKEHGGGCSDCTAEALHALLTLSPLLNQPVPPAVIESAINFMLARQNRDGGFSVYERQRVGSWIEMFNPTAVFGDVMTDHSFVECTSAVLQACALTPASRQLAHHPQWESSRQRALAYLRRAQAPAGGWLGSWGVCYTYGTWFGVVGLRAANVSPHDKALQNARQFLLSHQREDGGWGEDIASALAGRYVPAAESDIVQTAWAILALCHIHLPDPRPLDRAISFLLQSQLSDGSWPYCNPVGMCHQTCGLDYPNYPHYFPLWALGSYWHSRNYTYPPRGNPIS